MLVNIGLVQMPCTADIEKNQARAEAGVRDCAKQGAHIVCLQELFSSLYFCQTEEYQHFGLAEAVPGPTTDRFAKLAKELGVLLVVPVFERRAAGLYHNSALLIDRDGTIQSHYRKMHIPDDPGFMEKFYFTPGDLGFRVADTHVGKVAMLICWDQWFPEAARLVGLSGADILFYPTAIGWSPQQSAMYNTFADAWQISMRGHAIANGMFVAAVNRVGREGDLEFWGRSFVADPLGRVLGQCASNEENLVVEINTGEIEKTRQEWPFFRDRRIEAYGDLTLRYRG